MACAKVHDGDYCVLIREENGELCAMKVKSTARASSSSSSIPASSSSSSSSSEAPVNCSTADCSALSVTVTPPGVTIPKFMGVCDWQDVSNTVSCGGSPELWQISLNTIPWGGLYFKTTGNDPTGVYTLNTTYWGSPPATVTAS